MFLSTFGGVVILGIAVLVFGWMTNLSGYNVENIENLMFVAQNTMIDVGQLLLAGMNVGHDGIYAHLGTFWRISRYMGP